MKYEALILGLLIAAPAPQQASAAPFAPEPLKISASPQIGIHYGDPFTFPFTLSGGPASVGFAIFTQSQAPQIRDIRNGYLGWHYMNRIDTCMYLSPPKRFPSGRNEITWDGLDSEGYHMLIFQHRYYFWAYDTESSPGKALSGFRDYGFGRSTIAVRDEQGNPFANPALFSSARSLDSSGETWNTRARWVLGGDPDDLSLAETTRYRSHPDRGRIALSPKDDQLFFTQAIESGKMVSREWEWVSNGDAILQTYWGEDEPIDYYSALDPNTASYSGPVSVNSEHFISTDLARRDTLSFPALDYFDVSDGTLIKRADLSAWFGDSAVPTELAYRDDRLLLSSPKSALFIVAYPFFEEDRYFVQWENDIGDGFADMLPSPGEPRSTILDRNGFVHFMENRFAPSIGSFTPDGAGAGFVLLPGISGKHLDGMQIVETGSAFDGIYFGTTDSGDVLYTRFATCKGMVVDPAEWFISHVFIVRPWKGDTLFAGKTFPLTWHGADCSMLCIEFSSDDGSTWSTVANNIPETGFWGEYQWTVPDVRSTACRLRLTSTVNPLLTNTSGAFTISGPTGIEDASSPRPFITVTSFPNPFNPATAIRYTLGRPGRVTLTVHNALGQLVRRVDLGRIEAGAHEYRFESAGLTSGVYLYRVETEHAAAAGRMLLMK